MPALVRVQDWNGRVALVLPGVDEELAAMALAEAQSPPGAGRLAALPDSFVVTGTPVALPPAPVAATEGIARIARELHRHPIEVVIALTAQRQSIDVAEYSAELVTALRAQGIGEAPPPEPVVAPSLAIDDDPCPRRRHARTVLQRMLRMGKVGPATTPSSTTSPAARPPMTVARRSRWARLSSAPACSSRSRASASATSR